MPYLVRRYDRPVPPVPRRARRSAEAAEQPAGPVWAREAAARRPALSQRAIVAAAIALADAEGLEAVSIRRVAAELGARAMSLYTHIERKEDLLQLMADEVAGEALIPDDQLPAGWREAITMVVEAEAAVARRHPWMIGLVRGEVRYGPNGLRHAEQTLAVLSRLGLEAAETVRVAAAIDVYSMGRVMREDAERAIARRGHQLDAGEPYLQRLLAGGEFPHLGRLLAGGHLGPQPAHHDDGLRWLLDGIEARYGKHDG